MNQNAIPNMHCRPDSEHPASNPLGTKDAALREALEKAQHALAICYSDSHLIRVEWLREKGCETIAGVIDNIRKWSGSYRHMIIKALSQVPDGSNSPCAPAVTKESPPPLPLPEKGESL